MMMMHDPWQKWSFLYLAVGAGAGGDGGKKEPEVKKIGFLLCGS